MSQTEANEETELRQETYSERAWRLTKENPLVPIGTLATCAAFLMATVRWGQGNSRSLNLWLRGRVAAHFFTIGAAGYTMYSLGQFDSQNIQKRAQEIQQLKAQHEAKKERAGFEQRLREAEENHAADLKMKESAANSSWWPGWSKK